MQEFVGTTDFGRVRTYTLDRFGEFLRTLFGSKQPVLVTATVDFRDTPGDAAVHFRVGPWRPSFCLYGTSSFTRLTAGMSLYFRGSELQLDLRGYPFGLSLCVDSDSTDWLQEKLSRFVVNEYGYRESEFTVIELQSHWARGSELSFKWSLLHSLWSMRTKTPRWRRFYFEPKTALLGHWDVTSRKLVSAFTLDIPLPEGTYRWDVSIEKWTWSRPRSPFKIVRYMVDARAQPGEQLPIPGKGENSWDCGSDATYAMSYTVDLDKEIALSPKKVAEHVSEAVIATRRKRMHSADYATGGKYDPGKEN